MPTSKLNSPQLHNQQSYANSPNHAFSIISFAMYIKREPSRTSKKCQIQAGNCQPTALPPVKQLPIGLVRWHFVCGLTQADIFTYTYTLYCTRKRTYICSFGNVLSHQQHYNIICKQIITNHVHDLTTYSHIYIYVCMYEYRIGIRVYSPADRPLAAAATEY